MATPSSSGVGAYLALAIGVVGLGFSAIFVRVAASPGTVSVFYRMAIGAAVVTPLFLKQLRAQRDRLTRGAIGIALLAGALFALDLSFWASGIVIGGATLPTLMANTAPLWVGFGSLVFFGQRLRWWFWLGTLVAVGGAAIVLSAGYRMGAGQATGSLLGLAAALFYVAYYLVTQKGRLYLNALTYFWLTTASAALFLLIFNVLLGRSFVGYDRQTYLSLAALGIGPQAIGWLAINYAQGYLPAAIVAPTLLGQPVITAFISISFLEERFVPGHIIGGIAVLAGIYIVHWSRLRDRPQLKKMERWTTQERI